MAKELTIPEKLKGLYELQLVDSKIDEIEILKGELPMEEAILKMRLREFKPGSVV